MGANKAQARVEYIKQITMFAAPKPLNMALLAFEQSPLMQANEHTTPHWEAIRNLLAAAACLEGQDDYTAGFGRDLDRFHRARRKLEDLLHPQ